MIVFEVTEDKFGKLMKATSKIMEHAECLHKLFEDLSEEAEYSERSNSRRRYDDDDMYGSRYGNRRSGRYSY
jgi:hypothetical protein